jgi:hypothetical protein
MQRNGQIRRWPALHQMRRKGNELKIQESEDLKMKNAGESIRRSIIKRQEALENFQKKKIEFHTAKEQITRDINEARAIWKETLEKLPRQPFS